MDAHAMAAATMKPSYTSCTADFGEVIGLSRGGMRRCVSLCLALALLLLSLSYARAGNAAMEVRLGSGLFSDISTLVLAQLPNLTQAILPLPLPGQNNSVLNIKADIYDVALVDLQVPSVEVSIDPSAGFSLVMCAHPTYMRADAPYVRIILGTASRCA